MLIPGHQETKEDLLGTLAIAGVTEVVQWPLSSPDAGWQTAGDLLGDFQDCSQVEARTGEIEGLRRGLWVIYYVLTGWTAVRMRWVPLDSLQGMQRGRQE